MSDIEQAVQAIAAQLLPGWSVRVLVCSREEMDQRIPGALATCQALPERSLATFRIVSPWPAGESLSETLWHEATHAALSPITSQLGEHPGATMLEEQIVERIGNLLARAPAMARKAIAAALGRAPEVVRARISARGVLRARGGHMDPIDLILAAAEAAGEAEDPKEALMSLIGKIKAIKDGGAAPAAGDEPPESMNEPLNQPGGEPPAAKVGEMQPPGGTDGGYGGAQRIAARKEATVTDPETMRARKAAQDAADEIAAMAKAARPAALEGLVMGLRARMGEAFTPAMEKKIMAAPSFAKAQEIATLAEEFGGGQQRARQGGGDNANPGPGDVRVAVNELIDEGFSPSWIAMYQKEKDPLAAQAMIAQGRQTLRARKAANGAGKVS